MGNRGSAAFRREYLSNPPPRNGLPDKVWKVTGHKAYDQNSEDKDSFNLRSFDIKPSGGWMTTPYRCEDLYCQEHDCSRSEWFCTGKTIDDASQSHEDENTWDEHTKVDGSPWDSPPETSGCGDRDRGAAQGWSTCLASKGKFYGKHIAKIKYDDGAICPKLGDDPKIGAVGATSPIPGRDADEISKCIRCRYDVDQLASSCEAATQWTLMRRGDLDHDGMIGNVPTQKWFNQELMKRLCFKSTHKNCPASSKGYRSDSDGNPECDMTLACPLCKQWAMQDANGEQLMDLHVADYCSDTSKGGHFDLDHADDVNYSDPACKCIRVSDRPGAYQLGESKKCWYGPCQDAELSNYLTTSTIRNMDEGEKCAKNLCLNVINMEKASDIYIGDINLDVDCGDSKTYCSEHGFLGKKGCTCDSGWHGVDCSEPDAEPTPPEPTPPEPTPPEPTPPEPAPSGDDDDDDKKGNLKKVLIAGGVVLAVGVGVFAVALAVSKSNKKAKI